ncbi:MAG TPA: hypothetical protein VK191_10225, partial [Symbiobacteriaceae bacterium]|nr:hypothetical protein [Symbiobacteriaceae bacterium]
KPGQTGFWGGQSPPHQPRSALSFSLYGRGTEKECKKAAGPSGSDQAGTCPGLRLGGSQAKGAPPARGALVQPEAGALVQPEAGALVQPGRGALVQPGRGGLVQPEAGGLVQLKAGGLVQPEAGALDQPGRGGLVQPEAGARVQPEADSARSFSGFG